MFSRMLLFEWRFYTRQASFYICGGLFFFLAFLASSLDRIALAGANVLKNGPYSMMQMMVALSFFFLLPMVNFVAGAAVRDHSSAMNELLHCKPIKPLTYHLGRFFGAFSIVTVVFASVPLGLFLGTVMPWVDPAKVGPFQVSYLLNPLVFIALPGLLVFSCFFYAAAWRFRSMTAVYLAVIALFIGNEAAELLIQNETMSGWASLLDPFAANTVNEVTRYWTIFEKNTLSLNLEGVLLQNRLIWLAFGGATLWLFGRLHQPLSQMGSKRKARRRATTPKEATKPNRTESSEAALRIKGGRRFSLKTFWTRSVFEARMVLQQPSFGMLALGIVFILFLILTYNPGIYGTPHEPRTFYMIETIQRSLGIFVNIIILYYSAEIVHRDRATGIGDIIDALPVPNAAHWFAKIVSVWLVLLLLLGGSMMVTIGFQLFHGISDIELGQYLFRLFFFSALPWMMLTVVAFFLQVLSSNKYLGMLLFVGFIVIGIVLPQLGLAHHMFRFARAPQMIYSDMNGYGPWLVSHAWYMLYWAAVSAGLSILGYGLWHRGPQQSLKSRLKALNYQLGYAGRGSLAAAALIFLLAGSVIGYNTLVLNQYTSEQEAKKQNAAYEKQYAAYADDPIPTITAINIEVDIFPEERRIEASARFQVKNKSGQPIHRFLVSMPDFSPTSLLHIDGGRLGTVDGPAKTHWFTFQKPLQPDEIRAGTMTVTRVRRGFVDGQEDLTLMRNGTFINNAELFPFMGYANHLMLTDNNQRRKLGLPPAKRLPKLEEEPFHHQSFLGNGFDFIDFEAKISTSGDQIAMAPGYLIKEWREGDRRHFHYKMDQPMLHFYSVTSARLNVVKETYKGTAIEIYHHPTHTKAVPSMIAATKASLDYFGQHFSPYQHRQARIIEFPRYRNFAQSFAGTVPFTEGGFLFSPRKASHIDAAYKVTAHEMAHQWWGHQVAPANVQGSQVIAEALSNYSALMVLEKTYGKTKLRRYLKYELDEYLTGRTQEILEEMPLLRVENQNYIHYQKGSVVLVSLRDLMGEERLNKRLQAFLQAYRYSRPYPTTLDLLRFLKQDATPAERTYIDDCFQRITLYDLQAMQVNSQEQEDGTYKVSLTISARRFTADGKGRETEQDLDLPIELGLFSDHPDNLSAQDQVIYLKKHRIRTGKQTIELVVDRKPDYAGIDPFIKLIDRDSNDNVIGL